CRLLALRISASGQEARRVAADGSGSALDLRLVHIRKTRMGGTFVRQVRPPIHQEPQPEGQNPGAAG
ncbi:MAG: hypothetical protein DUD30_05605, partial [Lactobacillus sp.]